MPESRSLDTARVAKFRKELSAPAVDLDALRELSWSGIPPNLRPTVWRLLLGYAPPNADRRETVLARKRQEYREWVPQYYDIPNEDRSDDEIHTLRQISVDCPRTVPDVPFFQQTLMQTAIERVLYIWAIRHPASGYVQGINDLLTPFLTVFLSEIFEGDIDTWVVSKLSEDTLLQVEADSYWCLSKLLDGIQDHYTFAQPGIQRLVFRLKELVRRIDEPVSRHMEEHHLEFLQFAFRWFNCLLIREFPAHLVRTTSTDGLPGNAILGMDVICQAKSGMGKTAVFVLATLQQIEPVAGEVSALVLCHTRELAYQICNEVQRFTTYLPDVKVAVFYGGVAIKTHKDMLKNECPHIVVGTPGRILDLARQKDLNLKHVRHFILDECDKMLESLDMRRDVQEIFKLTPHDKQVMMFSATLSKEIRPVCKKFMTDPMEIYVDDETKLTLHGLVQHYIQLKENEKNRKLNDLLDALDFNQVVIFVKSVNRAAQLNKLLVECNFPAISIHSQMTQEERLTRYKAFKEGHKRILVATDLVGRGIDIERVNIVINYDMPENADTYLHRVGRAGRFGTKGLAITFVSSEEDSKKLDQVQSRFEVDIKALPEQIDTSTYMPS
ncbi:unnamed protein product [Closterium sp. Naga37s-1]|nr:unnamed protein product [Closterium sp. Naga37s-1]